MCIRDRIGAVVRTADRVDDVSPLAIAPAQRAVEQLAGNTGVDARRIVLFAGLVVIGRHAAQPVADDEVGKVIALRHLREVRGKRRIGVEPATLCDSDLYPAATFQTISTARYL